MARYCCVRDCFNSNLEKKCFHIPKTVITQKIWLERISRSDLKSSRRIDSYVVCEDHFNTECFGPDKKLIKFSLPTLKLPEYWPDENSGDIFYYERCGRREKSPDRKPSISKLEVVGDLKVLMPARVCGVPDPEAHSEDIPEDTKPSIVDFQSMDAEEASSEMFLTEVKTEIFF